MVAMGERTAVLAAPVPRDAGHVTHGLAGPGKTLVVLYGDPPRERVFGGLARRWCFRRPADAIVENATRPTERIFKTTVNALAATIDRKPCRARRFDRRTVVQSNAAVIRTLFAQAASRAHTEFVNA